jgi:hypothetical protein
MPSTTNSVLLAIQGVHSQLLNGQDDFFWPLGAAFGSLTPKTQWVLVNQLPTPLGAAFLI